MNDKTVTDHDVEIEGLVTVADLPPEISDVPELQPLSEVVIPAALKDPVDQEEMVHRDFDDSQFWRRIPGFRDVSRDAFMDHRFQGRRSITSVDELAVALGDLAPPSFFDDVRAGLARAPMALRISPYLLGLVDWSEPVSDPIRRQFIPLGSEQLPDHPMLTLDSLHEQADSPTAGLVHRYPDKVLFLPLDVCPVYCRYCTRSYAIGADTALVHKRRFKPRRVAWARAMAYLASRPEVEDVVVSGGDTYLLPPAMLKEIGETLLAIPHIRRIRFASKGPAVMPMKILSDREWTEALIALVEEGQQMCKEVCLHTHFNCMNEITEISHEAMDVLFRRGVTVRNQSVLIRGVNDAPEAMIGLVKQLAYMNVQPYYVYQHDMVRGVEELRTRVKDSMEIERQVRGTTAGFNTPTFVNDVPGGGGKRDIHSFDYYDEVTGVSVYRSPCVDEDKVYLYFDPLHLLPEEGRARWAAEAPGGIVREAVRMAGLDDHHWADRLP
ncbi:KamA family radical SAM protein [bacterium]|nr:KamA family radical SAM protein [candidate division CSSED10-310 bacterium]